MHRTELQILAFHARSDNEVKSSLRLCLTRPRQPPLWMTLLFVPTVITNAVYETIPSRMLIPSVFILR
jgi:hypothetical protein